MQVVTRPEDMPTACSWEVFFKSLGGAVGISVAQTTFSNVLLSRLQEIPGLDAMAELNKGAADVNAAQGVVPAALLGKVKLAYNYAITRAFIVPVAVHSSCCYLDVRYGKTSHWEGGRGPAEFDSRVYRSSSGVPKISFMRLCGPECMPSSFISSTNATINICCRQSFYLWSRIILIHGYIFKTS